MVVARLRERFSRRAVEPDLFDPRFLSRLDRVRIGFGRSYGRRAGETPVRGLTQESGIEIESFKSYAPGDDIRYVDWNAAGRLDQLLTRRFVAEREIPIHLFVDASASMGVPEADDKLGFALRLAVALGWVALNNNEPVRVAAMRSDGKGAMLDESPMLRHAGRFLRLKPFLASVQPSGQTALAEGVRLYLERHAEGGLAILLSDFLLDEAGEGGWRAAIESLHTRRLDVWAVQVVGRHERDLGSLRGRFRLHDAETGETRDVMISEAERRRYQQDFEERTRRLRQFCHRHGCGHVIALTERGVAETLTGAFPAEGMLRLR